MPRIRLVAPAVLIVSALVLASAPAVSARSDIALGISQYHGASTLASTIEDFGPRPASWTLWSTWGDPGSRDFPLDKAKQLDSLGVTPMIWWEPMRTLKSCDFARHRQIANGRYDRYIKRWARTAKQVPGTVLVRWAQEINGGFFPWGVRDGQCGNTARSFRAAWKHIVRLFRKVNARNVKFVWSVSNQRNCRPSPCNQYKPYWPGGKFVHYVGYSSFNWGEPKWIGMADGMANTYRKLREFTRKPYIVIELASNSEGGNKAQWILDGYPDVYNRFAGIRGISYLNVDLSSIGHPDWSLDSDNAMAAYKQIAQQERFQGNY